MAEYNAITSDGCGCGCSWFWHIGSAIAVVISWTQHEDIAWAFLHGVFGWFYVAYYVWYLN